MPQRRSSPIFSGVPPSAGIRHVLVGGVSVVREGEPVEGVAPGQPVWGRLRER